MYVDLVNVIWGFLKPLVSDAVKDRIKPKTSAERAKNSALQVYRSLRDVSTCSEAFVSALDEFSSARPSEREPSRLQAETKQLIDAMETFKKAFSEIEIQLEIHDHSTVEEFYGYTVPRCMVLDKASYVAEQTVLDAEQTNPDELKALVQSAKNNHENLSRATDSFREFLKEQFEFKESF